MRDFAYNIFCFVLFCFGLGGVSVNYFKSLDLIPKEKMSKNNRNSKSERSLWVISCHLYTISSTLSLSLHGYTRAFYTVGYLVSFWCRSHCSDESLYKPPESSLLHWVETGLVMTLVYILPFFSIFIKSMYFNILEGFNLLQLLFLLVHKLSPIWPMWSALKLATGSLWHNAISLWELLCFLIWQDVPGPSCTCLYRGQEWVIAFRSSSSFSITCKFMFGEGGRVFFFFL